MCSAGWSASDGTGKDAGYSWTSSQPRIERMVMEMGLDGNPRWRVVGRDFP